MTLTCLPSPFVTGQSILFGESTDPLVEESFPTLGKARLVFVIQLAEARAEWQNGKQKLSRISLCAVCI
jgi:hypothetical protein